MNNSKLSNFVSSFGATKLLLERARQGDFLIEALILYASLVDGLCRIGLVLNEQLKNNNSEINQDYIYQDDGIYGISERKIFKLSLHEEIITEEIFSNLNRLYDFRNKLIHRFFLSEIDYSKTKVFLSDYEQVYILLRKVIADLEMKQIESGIGMTRGDRTLKYVTEEVRHGVIKKVGLLNPDIIHSLGYTSVEEIVDFSKQNKLMEICVKCGHYKIVHINTLKLKIKNPNKNSFRELPGKCMDKECNCKKFSQ